MALFFCPGHNGRPGQQIQWQKEKVDEVHEIQRWTGEKGFLINCVCLSDKKKKRFLVKIINCLKKTEMRD